VVVVVADVPAPVPPLVEVPELEDPPEPDVPPSTLPRPSDCVRLFTVLSTPPVAPLSVLPRLLVTPLSVLPRPLFASLTVLLSPPAVWLSPPETPPPLDDFPLARTLGLPGRACDLRAPEDGSPCGRRSRRSAGS
jgi:hypothetical protein